jgi:hypothetical protein
MFLPNFPIPHDNPQRENIITAAPMMWALLGYASLRNDVEHRIWILATIDISTAPITLK